MSKVIILVCVVYTLKTTYKNTCTLKARTCLWLPVVLKLKRTKAFLAILVDCFIEKFKNVVLTPERYNLEHFYLGGNEIITLVLLFSLLNLYREHLTFQ